MKNLLTFRPFALIILPAMTIKQEIPLAFTREFTKSRFILKKDDAGFMVITRPMETGKALLLEFSDGRRQLTDVLTPTELGRLDSGCVIEVWTDEIRSVVFEELWKKSEVQEKVFASHLTAVLI